MSVQTWPTAQQAVADLAGQATNSPVWTGPLVQAEEREFDRLCPHYCDGSRRGVGEYLDGVAARSDLSMERISYAWRTQPTLLSFLADLEANERAAVRS